MGGCHWERFSVSLGHYMSETSVLGPILFSLYMLPLGHIISKFKAVSYHCYADDIQLYVSFKPNETDKLTAPDNCLTVINRDVTRTDTSVPCRCACLYSFC